MMSSRALCLLSISPSPPSYSVFSSLLSLMLHLLVSLPRCHFPRSSLTTISHFPAPLSCDLFSTSPYLFLSQDCCVKDRSGPLSERRQQSVEPNKTNGPLEAKQLQNTPPGPSSIYLLIRVLLMHPCMCTICLSLAESGLESGPAYSE